MTTLATPSARSWSPSHSGVMSLHEIRDILSQAKETGTIEWVHADVRDWSPDAPVQSPTC